MLGAVRKLFIPKPPAAVEDTYIALVQASRNPFFFTDLGVPDTIDGRFGLIVVHLFLLEYRLVAEGTTAVSPELHDFGQFLSEAFFNDMDSSLREFGVGDTGVSHRIKKMGKAYHGSLQAYAAGVKDSKLMYAALARNLYGTVLEGDVAMLRRMADYIEKMRVQLLTVDTAVITSGTYSWPDVAGMKV